MVTVKCGVKSHTTKLVVHFADEDQHVCLRNDP